MWLELALCQGENYGRFSKEYHISVAAIHLKMLVGTANQASLCYTSLSTLFVQKCSFFFGIGGELGEAKNILTLRFLEEFKFSTNNCFIRIIIVCEDPGSVIFLSIDHTHASILNLGLL